MNAFLWAECPEYAEIPWGEPSRNDPVQGQRGKVIFSVTLGSTIRMSSKQTPGILDQIPLDMKPTYHQGLFLSWSLIRRSRHWCQVRPSQSTPEKENGGGREAASATKGSPPRQQAKYPQWCWENPSGHFSA